MSRLADGLIISGAAMAAAGATVAGVSVYAAAWLLLLTAPDPVGIGVGAVLVAILTGILLIALGVLVEEWRFRR